MQIDPSINAFYPNIFKSPLVRDILKGKYLFGKEETATQMYERVARAIADSPAESNREDAFGKFYAVLTNHLFLPGGRILAGAGTNKRVTLMNCYVNGTIEDSMEGIMLGVSHLALTSQQGGGMGTSFAPIRPRNAILKRTHSKASGVLPFMDVYDQTGKTIRSAGDRRAAQMGTISDTHPDLPEFVKSKGEGLKDGTKRFSEFNLSVWTSDAFMSAVEDDAEWPLFFHEPPFEREPELEQYDFVDDNGVQQYVYSIWNARDLWGLVTKYTWEFSDPGVIFGDRVNEMNNLWYCEDIRCTNPCGEQPLPPYGTCNLGAINLANIIKNPFKPNAEIDWDLLAEVARIGVRFLDNVIDVTMYPLPEQEKEEFSKRRIGLGILGLSTMFSELGIRYGSQQSVNIAGQVMKHICINAYEASIELAISRGTFPLYDEKLLEGGFAKQLPTELRKQIREHGLRNGVILTIAPVGTGSLIMGNVSSGLEPDFWHEVNRNVRKDNTEEYISYTEKSYTKAFYEFVTGKTDTPEFMPQADELSILEHIKVQGALQRWVDASTSKTINVPEDIPYEKFLEVYDLAWKYGCKGCTTFRPSKYRNAIVSKVEEKKPDVLEDRPIDLQGTTYKVKWPSMAASMYITINYYENKPYEIFFASKDARYSDWMTGLTLMISSILRSGMDPSFIPRELKQVISMHDTAWDNGKFFGSLVSRIGNVIEMDFIRHGLIDNGNPKVSMPIAVEVKTSKEVRGEMCPSCSQPTLIKQEGCSKCNQCGYSSC